MPDESLHRVRAHRTPLRAPDRYHSLDALRALMMLLGIYLHTAVAYSEHGSWPWKDGSSTALFVRYTSEPERDAAN